MNIATKMQKTFPPSTMRAIGQIGAAAAGMEMRAYLVGGIVRDLLLGALNLDLDIAVEGDAISLGKALKKRLSGTLVAHERFGTCTLLLKDGRKVDLATARKESYRQPGALPDVEFSIIKDDLFRRDFTINAMAVSINRDDFGTLIDFFGGQRDLGRGRIRTLHGGSFVDDPTRIFRAVRFEQRYGFRINARNEDLIKYAVKEKMFDNVSPQRIRQEIVLILKEGDPLKALQRMDALHELRFIHPRLKLKAAIVHLLSRVHRLIRDYRNDPAPKGEAIEPWIIYFMALIDGLGYNSTSAICDRLVFTRDERSKVTACKKGAIVALKVLKSRGRVSPSKIYGACKSLSREALIYFTAKAPQANARRRVWLYLRKYSHVRSRISGDDLRKMGLEAGPAYTAILRRVLYQRLDGILKTKEDELAYARAAIERRRAT